MSEKTLREIFAKQLNSYMNLEGKTQSDLCKFMNVSSATASDWCNANKMPRTDKIQSIAKWLGVRIGDLMDPNYKITHEKLWIGEIVKKRREEMNLSCEELASLSNCDISYIKALESGAYNYPVKILENISDKLGLKVLDMLASLPSYYRIYQDNDGISRIDTCGLNDDNIFYATSYDESLLVDILYKCTNDDKKIHELLNFAKLLENNEFSTLSSVFSLLGNLNNTGIQKTIERINELIDLGYTQRDTKE